MCYLCGREHQQKSAFQQIRLNYTISSYETSKDALILSMHVFSLVKTKKALMRKTVKANSVAKLELGKMLKYIFVSINRINFNRLLDGGIKHYLVVEKLVTGLELTHNKKSGWVKVIDQPS